MIQIGNYVKCEGSAEPFVRTIFTLKDCAPIVGAQVLSYNDEREMLEVRSMYAGMVFTYTLVGITCTCVEMYVHTCRYVPMRVCGMYLHACTYLQLIFM